MVCAFTANAQTYLEHIQQVEVGKGKVTVHQASELDLIVNGSTAENVQVKRNTQAELTPKPAVIKEIDNDTVAVEPTKHDGPTKKMNGYRIQVYAGGNTRADKSKAESMGSKIKSAFPDEAVYVHFSSPRWICRMGNYKTYEEAIEMLNKVRAAGFNQASMVKGTITVSE